VIIRQQIQIKQRATALLITGLLVMLSACSSGGGGGSTGTAKKVSLTPSSSATDTPGTPAQTGGAAVVAGPAAPTISAPFASPFYSNGSALTIAGACVSGNDVNLSLAGASLQKKACAADAYSFSASQATDGTYVYSVKQTSSDGKDSATSATVTWIRSTVLPAAPTLTAPVATPYTSAENILKITGNCQNNALVTLSGASNQTLVCSATGYHFDVPQSTDGSFDFTLKQTDWAGNVSQPASLRWVRNTVVPSAPVVTLPAASPFYSNAGTLMISGTCTSGNTVSVSGALVQTVACASGAFSFSSLQAADGVFTYTLKQTSVSGLSSPTVSTTWNRSTVKPSAPVVTVPLRNPYLSADSALAISGTCLSGAVVSLAAGAAVQTTPCVTSAYSFSVNKSVNGTYDYALSQNDQYGNISAQTAFQWVRDTSIPATPAIVSPAARPYFSNASALVLSGTCVSGDAVSLSGADTQSVSCAAGAFSFTVNKSVDGSYSLSIKQTSLAGVDSAQASMLWNRQTVPPSAPTITTPSKPSFISAGNALTISGACLSNAVVSISGAATQSTPCTASAYSFNLAQSVDGTYDYSISQRDQAGNVSAPSAFQWVRDTSIPVVPGVSIPAITPYFSNQATLAISGSCANGALVTLSGSDSQTSTCASSAYSFTVGKSADGVYPFSLKQTSLAGMDSSAVTLSWTKDTLAPSTPSISSPAANPYLSGDTTLVVSGACETGAVIKMSGASSQTVTCAASAYSLTVTQATDGIFDFGIVAQDAAGNLSASAALKWTRDTAVPASPTITTPGATPYNSNASSLTISGGCVTGDLVSLGGAASQAQSCAAGTYAFTVPMSVDGTYAFSVKQTSLTNIDSAAVGLTWVRNTVAPGAPALSSPVGNPYLSGDTTLAIAGSCVSGNSVGLAGASTQNMACTGGAFSFSDNRSVDGTYNYSVTQTDLAGNTSAPKALSWVRDTAVPATPTIASPSASPVYTNTSALMIAGGCITGNTVLLSGSDTQSQVCVTSAYSFTAAKSVDGVYAYTLKQKSASGILSSGVALSWHRVTVLPAAPTLSSPATSPFYSSQSALTLAGACVTGNTVALSGAAVQSVACASSLYSFDVAQAADGSFDYLITQADQAGNVSPGVTARWVRDTTVPTAPTLTSPALTPFYSNGSSLTLAGTCTSGFQVKLSGAQTQSTSCSGSTFSFTLAQGADGNYPYQVTQTNLAGTSSAPLAFSWVRDTVAPSLVTITRPVGNPYTSADTALTLSGACETGATVYLTGAEILNTACTASAYSFGLNQSVDGSYTYSLSQKDAAGNLSASASFQWVRDTSIPTTPTITTPAIQPQFSNASSLTIAGACISGDQVSLGGADTQQMTCSGSAYSFSVSKNVDGAYAFTLRQKSTSGVYSASASLVWNRDTLAPAPIVLVAPASNPFASGDTAITLSGTCETGAQVALSGASAQIRACVSSAYSFSVSQAVDGTYDYSLLQTDRAGNVSGATDFEWVRDTSVPATPTIASPGSSPAYTHGASLTLSGSCIDGDTVTLSGDDDQAMVCASAAYSFIVNEAVDGTYAYAVKQTNPVDLLDSGQANLTWVRDTQAPTAPVISNPSTSPYAGGGVLDISGTCEADATVTLSGDDAQTVVCDASTTFDFTVTKSTDATYNFTLSQTDLAGNPSASASVQWIRSSSLPSTPTITSPATNPFISNLSTFTLAGGCTTGDTVKLTGDVSASDVTSPAGSLTQLCAGSTYSFVLGKSVDATYNFSVTQSLVAMTSGAATAKWVRDTVAPDTSFTSTPPAQNLASSVSFSFTSPKAGVKFECQLDGSAFASCVSPVTLASVANGTHTYQVRARDTAGNVDATPASYTWSQQRYNTLALYHFDTAPGATVDSSLYTGATNNPLTDHSTTSNSLGKFAQGRNFTASSSQYLQAASSATLALTSQTMSIEAHAKLTSLPSRNASMVIASKTGASPQMGWEFKIKRISNSYYMVMSVSLNGTKSVDVASSALTLGSGTYHHFAATWNKGSVAFYYDGVAKGIGTVGTVGTAGTSTIFNSTGALLVGKNATSSYMNGVIDELRISQNLRWTGTFTVPTAAYSPD
jgi:hypothetical protein